MLWSASREFRRGLLRAWQALQTYYMFVVSLLLLVSAGAVAVGAFGFTDSPSPQRPATQAVASATQSPVTSPAPLVLTYYMVATEEYLAVLNSLENQLVHREWLGKSAFEVLLVRTAEEEVQAVLEIEAAKRRSPSTRVLVEDLRLR